MIEVMLILVIVFIALLVMDVPIAVAIAVASMLAMMYEGYDPNLMVASKMANGIDSFALLAIPFFILSGILMGRGGMARRLMDLVSGRLSLREYADLYVVWLHLGISGSGGDLDRWLHAAGDEEQRLQQRV